MHSNVSASMPPMLDAKNIKSFAIAAYGRDFTSDISVSTIEFYY